MRDISLAIQEHKAEVLKYYPEYQILGIFVYGSQNYNIATENSDVDTKAVIIPHITDLALNPVKTKTLILENGEHCEIMDIMHLVANFRKQNINFVEVLFTEHYWINPLYVFIWHTYFRLIREDIANYNPQYCLKSICGQAIHTLKQNKTDAKKYANGLRLRFFLQQYLNDHDYWRCITIPNETAEYLKYLKTDKPLISEEHTNNLIEWFERVSKTILIKVKPEETDRIDYLMNTGIITMIRLCEDCYNERR